MSNTTWGPKVGVKVNHTSKTERQIENYPRKHFIGEELGVWMGIILPASWAE